MLWSSSTDTCAPLNRRRPFPTNRTIKSPNSRPYGQYLSRQSTSNFLLFWTSFALVSLSLLLIALPKQAQAAALSIPVSEMLREADEPFERDDRDYRPLQVGHKFVWVHPCWMPKFCSLVNAMPHIVLYNSAKKVSIGHCNSGKGVAPIIGLWMPPPILDLWFRRPICYEQEEKGKNEEKTTVQKHKKSHPPAKISFPFFKY